MALQGTPTVKSPILPLTCALDSTHKIAAGHMYKHLVTQHSCSDTGITGPSYLPSRKGGNEKTRWHKREGKRCLICEAHAVTRQFRHLNTANETDSGDSLQTHLTSEHGGS